MATEPDTSLSLIWRAKRKEPNAWETMCEIYAPLVFDWATRAGLQEADAGDIVQDVFLAISKGLAKFRNDRPGDKFRAWLWTITRNELRRWYRNSQKDRGNGGTDALIRLHHVPDWVFDDGSVDEVDADDTAEIALVRRAANLIQGDFDEHTWNAFWRVTVDGQSSVDVAADLNMSPGAVRQAKFRVLLRLREFLE